jgi:hypothetical protein
MTVIKFPNTPANQMSDTAKLAIEMEKEKQTVEIFLNWRLNQDDWETYCPSERDLEILAMFGEHMKLHFIIAARLASKLAEIICKAKLFINLDIKKND